MFLVTQLLQLAQVKIEDLPPDLVDALPDDVLQQLKDGVLDKIPADVINSLPGAIQDKIPDGLIQAAAVDTTFGKILLAIAILAVIGFIIGVVKSAVKWMIYSAILAVVAWYLFFQQ